MRKESAGRQDCAEEAGLGVYGDDGDQNRESRNSGKSVASRSEVNRCSYDKVTWENGLPLEITNTKECGRAYEGHHSCRWLRHEALPPNKGHEQAAPSGL